MKTIFSINRSFPFMKSSRNKLKHQENNTKHSQYITKYIIIKY